MYEIKNKFWWWCLRVLSDDCRGCCVVSPMGGKTNPLAKKLPIRGADSTNRATICFWPSPVKARRSRDELGFTWLVVVVSRSRMPEHLLQMNQYRVSNHSHLLLLSCQACKILVESLHFINYPESFSRCVAHCKVSPLFAVRKKQPFLKSCLCSKTEIKRIKEAGPILENSRYRCHL